MPKAKQIKPHASLTLNAYATHRGVSYEAVRRAIGRGTLRESVVLVEGRHRIASAEQADREWEANTQAESERAALPSPLLTARIRREQAAADHAELELAQKRGELISIGDARRDVVEKFTIVKTRMLAIPSRVAQRLPHVASFVLPVLDELLREALEALAEGEA